jgi:RNA polymerase sigma-32 factor
MIQNQKTQNSLIRDAMNQEMLDAELEAKLARAWRDNGDTRSLHRLIRAYMRLAVSMSIKFERPYANRNDLIQEAMLGLMKAAEKFDPDRNVRFSTYAMWWIKAGLQDYVMRNWSMVRTGSTSSQKSLFYNINRLKTNMENDAMLRGETLSQYEIIQKISDDMGVNISDTEMMLCRMSARDMSLNIPQNNDNNGRECIEFVEDEGAEGAETVEKRRIVIALRNHINEAMSELSSRERYVLKARKLNENPRTLSSIGQEIGISKERVRQIEAVALQKVRRIFVKKGFEIQDFVT